MAALKLMEFQGRWRIERRIDDLAAGKVATLTGTAEFSPAAGGLDYFEVGELRMEDGDPIRAERRYRWRFDQGKILVDFEDGRPFHSFDPTTFRPTARHFCEPDEYRVIYSFARWPEWRAEWRVEGPKKLYRMTTEYHR